MQFIQGKPLKEFSTFGIGGPAAFFAEAHSVEDLKLCLAFAQEKNIPYLIIGKGSNCLFDDQGFAGLAILNKIHFCTYPEPSLVYAGSGYSFSLLGSQTAKKGLGGLEFASGIPGSVGGAVYMNAGANGSETCEALESVDWITEDGNEIHLSRNEIQFAYRWSCFQKTKGAIAAATFRLTPSTQARGRQLEIIDYRKQTQPLKEMSAGCVFRNPPSGHAGKLIEECGLKGISIGGASISLLHANFIVNTSDATSSDVLTLIGLIQHAVKQKTGFELICEIKYIPYTRGNDEHIFSR